MSTTFGKVFHLFPLPDLGLLAIDLDHALHKQDSERDPAKVLGSQIQPSRILASSGIP
jgi:hypothetical protein